MRAECVQAVQAAAQRFGKTLTAANLRDIEVKIVEAKKQLAKQDINAYRQMTREEQTAKAGELVLKKAEHDAIIKRRNKELTVIKEAEKTKTLQKMMASGMDAMEAARYFTAQVSDGRGGVRSLESHIQGVSAYYLRKIPSFFKLMDESSIGGIQTSRKNTVDYLKETYGQDSGNPLAKKAWAEVQKANNELIDHFNRNGGDVAKLANYRNPQAMYAYKVLRRGGKNGEQFVKDYMQWVDRNEYVNPDGSLMNDEQLARFLKEAWTTVVTDGASKPTSDGAGTSSVANRMKAHRQLHLKSPEAYIAAMDKYGAGDLLEQVRGHIESMSSDIALTDRFGPNAIASFNKMYQEAALATGKTDAMLQDAFSALSGQVTTNNVAMAHWFGEMRSAMVASRLGSMLVSQLSDAGTAKMVANSLGVHTHELLGWVGTMGTDAEARDIMRLTGIGLESAINSITRFASDASTMGFFGKAASAVPTIQGANLWTRIWRQGFGASLHAKLGDMTLKYDWNTMPELDRNRLESLGVTERDWKIWKLATPTDYKGSRLLVANDIERIDANAIKDALGLTARQAEDARQNASINLVSFVLEQSHQAIIQPNALTQAVLGGERGKLSSEFGKLITQFKSFPVAMWRQMFIERASFAAAGYNPWVFRTKMLAVTTMLGGTALMLGDILNGKDPRKIDTPEAAVDFGWKAMAKGGGLGWAGDFADIIKESAENPFAITGVFGPVAGYVGGSVAPMIGHGASALVTQDEKEIQKFAKHSYDSIKGITPGQNLWFIKAFLHNILLDDLQEMANPGYKERAKQRAMDNYGQSYYMGMDEETRAPDMDVLEQ